MPRPAASAIHPGAPWRADGTGLVALRAGAIVGYAHDDLGTLKGQYADGADL